MFLRNPAPELLRYQSATDIVSKWTEPYNCISIVTLVSENIQAQVGQSWNHWNPETDAKVNLLQLVNVNVQMGGLKGQEDVDSHAEGPETISRHEPRVR
jgi:hypothetical protein